MKPPTSVIMINSNNSAGRGGGKEGKRKRERREREKEVALQFSPGIDSKPKKSGNGDKRHE